MDETTIKAVVEGFILSKREYATSLTGINTSLFQLGQGMHTIMDCASPSHEGYQNWLWSDIPSFIWDFSLGKSEHINSESTISQDKLNQISIQLREYYYEYLKNR